MRKRSAPIRTCIATRVRAPQDQLLRVKVCPDSLAAGASVVIVPDPAGRIPGRGAWITPSVEAWDQAEQRRAFSRALRTGRTPIDATPVRQYLEKKEQQH